VATAIDLDATSAVPAVIADASKALLRTRGLSKSYGAGRDVLCGVDVTVGEGESVSLIGSNGSGKSTFLRCCLRLIEPTSGQIRLFDEDIVGLTGARLRRVRSRVGFVFQRHNLVPRLSALSNVVHGAQARSGGPRVWHQALAPAETRAEAISCLARVGLAHKAMQRVDTLSGGQSQRVAIARALMQRPRFVIADEPVASLDPAAGEEIMALFVRLMREDGVTVLFTSHHLDHAVAHADRIIGLRDGELVLDAPAETQSIEQLSKIYGVRNSADA